MDKIVTPILADVEFHFYIKFLEFFLQKTHEVINKICVKLIQSSSVHVLTYIIFLIKNNFT